MQLVCHFKKKNFFQFQVLKFFLFLFKLFSHLLGGSVAAATAGGCLVARHQMGLMTTDAVTQYFLQLTKGQECSVTV